MPPAGLSALGLTFGFSALGLAAAGAAGAPNGSTMPPVGFAALGVVALGAFGAVGGVLEKNTIDTVFEPL